MDSGRLFVLMLFLWISVDKNCVEHTSTEESDLFETIYGARGVLVFKNTDKSYHKNILLYTNDKDVFATISPGKHYIKFGKYKVGLSGVELSEAMLDRRYRFNPQEFYPDYGVIIFAYKSIRNGKAEVYIDKEKTTTKFIKIDPILFSVENWRQHLMGAITGIENTKNSLKESPGDLLAAKKINVPGDASFRIIKFEGQWVQVECVSFCESVCEKKYKGWIRWTNGKQLLLVLYYAC